MAALTKFATLVLATFACLTTGSPLDPRMEAYGYTLLGYRTVNKGEAQTINKAGHLVYDSRFDQKHQLGLGKSLSGGPGEWDIGGGNWYCYVFMHTEVLKKLNKAWIPRTYWFDPEAAISNYITSGKISDASKKWDASKTLRFARVDTKDFNELFIPNALVKTEAGATIVECFETKAKMEAEMKELEAPMVKVDYTSTVFAGPKPKE